MFYFKGTKKEEIGKMALLLAMSEESEELPLMAEISKISSELNAGISFVGGPAEEVSKSVVQTTLSCAKKNGILESKSMHGLIHATTDAFNRFSHEGLLIGHLKIKIAIVTNENWLGVAMYGYSSINRALNHEKSALSINHI